MLHSSRHCARRSESYRSASAWSIALIDPLRCCEGAPAPCAVMRKKAQKGPAGRAIVCACIGTTIGYMRSRPACACMIACPPTVVQQRMRAAVGRTDRTGMSRSANGCIRAVSSLLSRPPPQHALLCAGPVCPVRQARCAVLTRLSPRLFRVQPAFSLCAMKFRVYRRTLLGLQERWMMLDVKRRTIAYSHDEPPTHATPKPPAAALAAITDDSGGGSDEIQAKYRWPVEAIAALETQSTHELLMRFDKAHPSYHADYLLTFSAAETRRTFVLLLHSMNNKIAVTNTNETAASPSSRTATTLPRGAAAATTGSASPASAQPARVAGTGVVPSPQVASPPLPRFTVMAKSRQHAAPGTAASSPTAAASAPTSAGSSSQRNELMQPFAQAVLSNIVAFRRTTGGAPLHVRTFKLNQLLGVLANHKSVPQSTASDVPAGYTAIRECEELIRQEYSDGVKRRAQERRKAVTKAGAVIIPPEASEDVLSDALRHALQQLFDLLAVSLGDVEITATLREALTKSAVTEEAFLEQLKADTKQLLRQQANLDPTSPSSASSTNTTAAKPATTARPTMNGHGASASSPTPAPAASSPTPSPLVTVAAPEEELVSYAAVAERTSLAHVRGVSVHRRMSEAVGPSPTQAVAAASTPTAAAAPVAATTTAPSPALAVPTAAEASVVDSSLPLASPDAILESQAAAFGSPTNRLSRASSDLRFFSDMDALPQRGRAVAAAGIVDSPKPTPKQNGVDPAVAPAPAVSPPPLTEAEAATIRARAAFVHSREVARSKLQAKVDAKNAAINARWLAYFSARTPSLSALPKDASQGLSGGLRYEDGIKNVLHTYEDLELRHLIRSVGIPQRYRARVWRAMTGLEELKALENRAHRLQSQKSTGTATNTSYYRSLAERGMELTANPALATDKRVRDALAALASDFSKLGLSAATAPASLVSLHRILLAYAVRNPATGYMQNLNHLASMALLVLDNSAEADPSAKHGSKTAGGVAAKGGNRRSTESELDDSPLVVAATTSACEEATAESAACASSGLVLPVHEEDSFYLLIILLEEICAVQGGEVAEGPKRFAHTSIHSPLHPAYAATCASPTLFYFSADLLGLRIDQEVFSALLKLKLPKVYEHLVNRLEIPLEPFLLNWNLHLFICTLPLDLTLRVWDLLLSEGNKVLFRVGLTILHLASDIILATENSAQLLLFLKGFIAHGLGGGSDGGGVGSDPLGEATDAFIKSAYHTWGWMGSLKSSRIHFLRKWYRSRLENATALMAQQKKAAAKKDLASAPNTPMPIAPATAAATQVDAPKPVHVRASADFSGMGPGSSPSPGAAAADSVPAASSPAPTPMLVEELDLSESPPPGPRGTRLSVSDPTIPPLECGDAFWDALFKAEHPRRLARLQAKNAAAGVSVPLTNVAAVPTTAVPSTSASEAAPLADITNTAAAPARVRGPSFLVAQHASSVPDSGLTVTGGPAPSGAPEKPAKRLTESSKAIAIAMSLVPFNSGRRLSALKPTRVVFAPVDCEPIDSILAETAAEIEDGILEEEDEDMEEEAEDEEQQETPEEQPAAQRSETSTADAVPEETAAAELSATPAVVEDAPAVAVSSPTPPPLASSALPSHLHIRTDSMSSDVSVASVSSSSASTAAADAAASGSNMGSPAPSKMTTSSSTRSRKSSKSSSRGRTGSQTHFPANHPFASSAPGEDSSPDSSAANTPSALRSRSRAGSAVVPVDEASVSWPSRSRRSLEEGDEESDGDLSNLDSPSSFSSARFSVSTTSDSDALSRRFTSMTAALDTLPATTPAAYRNCHGCKKQIKDSQVIAMGLHFCAGCFVCSCGLDPETQAAGCGHKTLVGEPWLIQQGALFSNACFNRVFARKCAVCQQTVKPGEPLMGSEEGEGGELFHTSCVSCVRCGRNAGEVSLYVSPPVAAGTGSSASSSITPPSPTRYACEDCFTTLHAPKCFHCDNPIVATAADGAQDAEDGVLVEGQLYHANCLTCAVCECTFSNIIPAPDIVLSNLPQPVVVGKERKPVLYCASHARDAERKNCCTACKEPQCLQPTVNVPVLDFAPPRPGVTAATRLAAFHQSCAKCLVCSTPIVTPAACAAARVVAGDPYCAAHATRAPAVCHCCNRVVVEAPCTLPDTRAASSSSSSTPLRFHQRCFACTVCSKSLRSMDPSLVLLDSQGKLQCRAHTEPPPSAVGALEAPVTPVSSTSNASSASSSSSSPMARDRGSSRSFSLLHAATPTSAAGGFRRPQISPSSDRRSSEMCSPALMERLAGPATPSSQSLSKPVTPARPPPSPAAAAMPQRAPPKPPGTPNAAATAAAAASAASPRTQNAVNAPSTPTSSALAAGPRVCDVCCSSAPLPTLSLGSSLFHPNCLRCAQCRAVFEGGAGIYPRDGSFFCRTCFVATLAGVAATPAGS